MSRAALSLLAVLALAGCAGPACEPGEGAVLLAEFGAAPPMSALGDALVAAGWNVTEGATELAATRSFAELGETPDVQAVHLTLVQPATMSNVTSARLTSHVPVDDAGAEEALAPAVEATYAALRPVLGEPVSQLHFGC